MEAWRQGDVTRPGLFAYLADTRRPGTDPSRKAAAKQGVNTGLTVVRTQAAGLVVISQTCDIVAKSAAVAPFVDVAALVELHGTEAGEAAAGDRPRFVAVPRIGETWFADLDQVQTLEKAVLVDLQPEHGVDGDQEQAAFGAAVGRKYSRFAFPDELHRALYSLQKRVKKRHGKPASPEGILLRRVLQIRVEAHPNWEASQIEVTVTFILRVGEVVSTEEAPVMTGATTEWLTVADRAPAEIAERLLAATTPGDVAVLWDRLVDKWAEMCSPNGNIARITAETVCADDYSIARAWGSQRLDLDYLSGQSAGN